MMIMMTMMMTIMMMIEGDYKVSFWNGTINIKLINTNEHNEQKSLSLSLSLSLIAYYGRYLRALWQELHQQQWHGARRGKNTFCWWFPRRYIHHKHRVGFLGILFATTNFGTLQDMAPSSPFPVLLLSRAVLFFFLFISLTLFHYFAPPKDAFLSSCLQLSLPPSSKRVNPTNTSQFYYATTFWKKHMETFLMYKAVEFPSSSSASSSPHNSPEEESQVKILFF